MKNTHNNHTKGVTEAGPDATTSASFHALTHRQSIERELATLLPDGDVAERLTATAARGLAFYDIAMPQSKHERNLYCRFVASRLLVDGATAAAISCTGAAHGQERICVLAVDRNGGEEGWTARIIRSSARPPRIGKWVRGEPGGNFTLMLRAGVNMTPDCKRR